MNQLPLLSSPSVGAPGADAVPFLFDSYEVRVVVRDGAPWFVGKDVAGALGYSNPQKAVRDHCKAGVAVGVNDSFIPLDPQTVVIPERDLYRLVMRSHLPSAERFEEWVVAEVLPSIRNTGAYVAPAAPASPALAVGDAHGLVPLSEALALSVDRGMTSKSAAGAVLRAASLSLFPGAQAIFDAMRPSRAASARKGVGSVDTLAAQPHAAIAPPARQPRAKAKPAPQPVRLLSTPPGGFDGLTFCLAEAGAYVVGGESALRAAMLARGFITDAGGPTPKGHALAGHKGVRGHHWRLGDLFRALGAKP